MSKPRHPCIRWRSDEGDERVRQKSEQAIQRGHNEIRSGNRLQQSIEPKPQECSPGGPMPPTVLVDPLILNDPQSDPQVTVGKRGDPRKSFMNLPGSMVSFPSQNRQRKPASAFEVTKVPTSTLLRSREWLPQKPSVWARIRAAFSLGSSGCRVRPLRSPPCDHRLRDRPPHIHHLHHQSRSHGFPSPCSPAISSRVRRCWVRWSRVRPSWSMT